MQRKPRGSAEPLEEAADLMRRALALLDREKELLAGARLYDALVALERSPRMQFRTGAETGVFAVDAWRPGGPDVRSKLGADAQEDDG